jgi:hypothetical protein
MQRIIVVPIEGFRLKFNRIAIVIRHGIIPIDLDFYRAEWLCFCFALLLRIPIQIGGVVGAVDDVAFPFLLVVGADVGIGCLVACWALGYVAGLVDVGGRVGRDCGEVVGSGRAAANDDLILDIDGAFAAYDDLVVDRAFFVADSVYTANRGAQWRDCACGDCGQFGVGDGALRGAIFVGQWSHGAGGEEGGEAGDKERVDVHVCGGGGIGVRHNRKPDGGRYFLVETSH